MFLKYLRMMQDPNYQNTDDLQQIPIRDIPISMLENVKLQIYTILVLCNRRT